MKQIVINTETLAGTAAFALFQREGLMPGDALRILRRPRLPQDSWVAMVMLVMLTAKYFLRQRSQGDGEPTADHLLKELRLTNGAEALKKELQDEFDVDVTLDPELDADREFWSNVGLWGMSAGYADDEPDISHIPILEPNPDYIPWKPKA
ncbi:MAG: hypothetical protein ACOH13_10245 [Flavobacteriales bacterium]